RPNMIAAFRLPIFEEESDSELGDCSDNEDINEHTDEQLWTSFDIKRLNCFAHILNSSLKAVFENTTFEFIQFKNSILSFSSKINKSGKKVEFLTGISNKKLLHYSNTRWNCFYLMLGRIQELKNELLLLSGKFDIPINFSWQQVNEYIEILKPFHLFTYQSQGNSESISTVLPNIIGLNEHLTSMAEKYTQKEPMMTALKEHLKRKFNFT
ncbi:MAG: hypothetical protein MHPSP_004421, partial [Paramarteilia canceri]